MILVTEPVTSQMKQMVLRLGGFHTEMSFCIVVSLHCLLAQSIFISVKIMITSLLQHVTLLFTASQA